MLYHAENIRINLGDACVDGIVFGNGKEPLIMIPGLGDGLRTVRGLAIPFSVMYRQYSKQYRVYAFSRRNPLPAGFTTREMAGDIKAVMDQLEIKKANIIGVSQGGMIAQYLAIDHPEAVGKLVLAVTLSESNDAVRLVIGRWIQLAQQNDYRSLFIDTAERSYTDGYLRRKGYRLMYPLLSRIGKPKDLKRFLIQANACLTHEAADELHRIHCPTLIIGGDSDQVVGNEAAALTAARIADSRLLIYPGLGHALYEEATDFHLQVLTFLQQK